MLLVEVSHKTLMSFSSRALEIPIEKKQTKKEPVTPDFLLALGRDYCYVICLIDPSPVPFRHSPAYTILSHFSQGQAQKENRNLI